MEEIYFQCHNCEGMVIGIRLEKQSDGSYKFPPHGYPRPKPLSYAPNGQPFYREAKNGSWTIIA
jgi:hypothetical protein